MSPIKIIIIAFVLFTCLTSCYPLIYNQYGRTHLKNMRYKNRLDHSKTNLLDTSTIYYYHSESPDVDREFVFIIRFFKTGQYAYYAKGISPIIHLSFENLLSYLSNNSNSTFLNLDDLDYNNLQKASYVGYYELKKGVIVLEAPNHLFRRGSRRNIDKYEILPNGDLKSVTKAASDYKHTFKKISKKENHLKTVIPDW